MKRKVFNTAPGAWGHTRINVPGPMRTMSAAQVTTGNWPAYPDQMAYAMNNPAAASVAPGTFFLPIAAAQHPYSGAAGAVRAVRDSQAQLAGFAQYAIQKATNGIPLTSAEVRAVKAHMAAMPPVRDEIYYNQVKQQAARARGVDYGARQIPFVPLPQAMPVRLMKLLNAVRTGSMIDPTGLVSTAALRMAHAANTLRDSIYARVGRPGIPVYR